MGDYNKKRSKSVAAGFQTTEASEVTINSQVLEVFGRDSAGLISLAAGAVTIASLDTQTDFAKGARIIKTDEATGLSGIYENIGTSAISVFALISTPPDSAGAGGLFVKKTALAVYDFAVDGGTEGTITLASTATIPDNAVVTATTYDVVTTLTSATDAATIKLNLPTDGDLSTAIAISDGTNPWDLGTHLASVITPIAQKTTAARALQIITAGGENITAGKIVFAVDYYVSA